MFEEQEIKNGIVSIYNDDENGMIAIEMEENNLKNIINSFDPYIM